MQKSFHGTFLLIFVSILFLVTGCVGPCCTKEEIVMNKELECYGKTIAQEQNMQFLLIGDATDGRETVYCLTLRSEQPTRLNQGRILAANNVKNFIAMLRTSPTVKAYVDHWRSEDTNYPEEVPLSKVGYKIVFWDKNIDRPMRPYLAEILFVDSTFYYFEADATTQQLYLVFSEPYESALRFRNQQNQASSK